MPRIAITKEDKEILPRFVKESLESVKKHNIPTYFYIDFKENSWYRSSTEYDEDFINDGKLLFSSIYIYNKKKQYD